jgi:hypothetical protein
MCPSYMTWLGVHTVQSQMHQVALHAGGRGHPELMRTMLPFRFHHTSEAHEQSNPSTIKGEAGIDIEHGKKRCRM